MRLNSRTIQEPELQIRLCLQTTTFRACLYDPGQAGRDAYRDPARNTNSEECLYDPATYPA
jgi:hypothetical protein